jgi:hypothetical protein
MYSLFVAVPVRVMCCQEDRGRKLIYLINTERMPVTINDL